MNKQQKADTIAELKDTLAKVPSLVLADFRGVTVAQVNGLRSEIRKNDCVYRVIKNTLVKKAIEGTALEALAPHFRGPTAVAYSFNDPVAPAKVLSKFAEDLEHLEIKAGFVDGEVLDAKGVDRLAKMKSKDELRADFLALMMAPATELVRLLAAGPTNFLLLLKAREAKVDAA